MRLIRLRTALILLILLLTACGKSETEKTMLNAEEKKTAEKNLERLSGAKIFFGHQSVGFNIIDGLNDISSQLPGKKLNIVETSNPADFGKPVFAHSKVGTNCDPSSKLADFGRIMASGVGEKTDIAFFKFCYVDITANSDVNAIFKEYAEKMSALKATYPKVTFVHVTVPLMAIDRGFKARIKALLGRADQTVLQDNAKRNAFNAMLLDKYEGREPVFDLASLEATTPEGTMESFELGGNRYRALYPGYTFDGGHLNSRGRQRVAEGLLSTLSSLRQ